MFSPIQIYGNIIKKFLPNAKMEKIFKVFVVLVAHRDVLVLQKDLHHFGIVIALIVASKVIYMHIM